MKKLNILKKTNKKLLKRNALRKSQQVKLNMMENTSAKLKFINVDLYVGNVNDYVNQIMDIMTNIIVYMVK